MVVGIVRGPSGDGKVGLMGLLIGVAISDLDTDEFGENGKCPKGSGNMGCTIATL